MPDAVVIGAGPNGLVAANVLADAGWDVLVLEAQDEPGGGVRSDRGVHPEYVSDFCSSFYPLAVASPVIRALELERYGLRWRHAPAVLAHPLPGGRCAVLEHDPDRTAAGLDALAPGDGEAWLRLYGRWLELSDDLLQAVLTPFPPVRPGLALAARLGAADGLRMLRLLALPVRRLGEEEFTGEGARLLLAGSALHADLSPESVGSTVFGWILTMIGQQYGWPVPEGGASALTAALVRRLEERGGEVRCSAAVTSVIVREGRALGVRTADGEAVRARRGVLADVPATHLYGGLVGWEHLPSRLRDDMRRFQWDTPAFKVDWALSGPIPWSAPEAARAGTVHVADGVNALTEQSAMLATGRVPADPFLLLGQMTTADASRSPAGTESAWAYTHVPHEVRADGGPDGVNGVWDERERQAMADRVEAVVERHAPGFRRRVLDRRVLSPLTMQEHDANLVGGAINGGTAAVHQQLFFRPVPGTGRAGTPVRGLYLASASAHPGGGVHGACGANAARAALSAEAPVRRFLLAPALSSARRLLSRP
ncbi:phytoene desaturase family protein [Actinocorallia populi]|uniref:phytoene desaturase family protein n=1 Tax=Actinocorallia populi TaxID=2079200 RepID=UPI000D0918B8|nr:NAD(P)/FAD-dependent oxidoreductase [Actinocorallia populi]